MFSLPSKSGEKPRQSLWEFSTWWKLSIVSQVLTDLLSNSPKPSPRFAPGYEGKENMFYLIEEGLQDAICFINIRPFEI